MLKDRAEPDWAKLSAEQVASLEDLKSALLKKSVLEVLKRYRPFMVDTDVSKYAMGATLLQQQDMEHKKTWATVGC